MTKNYIELNKEAWNQKTKIHVKSNFYNNEAFNKGGLSLNDIETALLTDIENKKVLHLQCHFGQDTISLCRMGAREVVGIDLSDAAIEEAIKLNAKTGEPARFVCCNLYDLPKELHETFDMVFTSYGTIGWLPDVNKWAAVVAHFLAPGGTFVFAEFHPVVWMFDDDFKEIKYRYFTDEPIIETTGTYTDGGEAEQQTTVGWNHGIAEVIAALLNQGLVLEKIQEYDYSPHPCFKNCVAIAPKKYRIEGMGAKLPMVYALKLRKPI
ncbi:methyltransferase domain-containing protein [bacterium]|nr:methyltransferase domain-containing protein [bacterium]